MSKNVILTSLEVGSSLPLDAKRHVATLAEISTLGIGNARAYIYYEDMVVHVVATHADYQWREEATAGETGGLLTASFTYPSNIEAGGIIYSNRVFNLFPYSSGGGGSDLQGTTDIGARTTNTMVVEDPNVATEFMFIGKRGMTVRSALAGTNSGDTSYNLEGIGFFSGANAVNVTPEVGYGGRPAGTTNLRLPYKGNVDEILATLSDTITAIEREKLQILEHPIARPAVTVYIDRTALIAFTGQRLALLKNFDDGTNAGDYILVENNVLSELPIFTYAENAKTLGIYWSTGVTGTSAKAELDTSLNVGGFTVFKFETSTSFIPTTEGVHFIRFSVLKLREALIANNFYDEGLFTPTLEDSLGGGTYIPTNSKGTYIRAGNSITFEIMFTNISTTGSPTGTLLVKGLPFPFGNGGQTSFGEISDLGSSRRSMSLSAQKSGLTDMFVRYKDSNFNTWAGYGPVTYTNGVISVTGTYITNVYTP